MGLLVLVLATGAHGETLLLDALDRDPEREYPPRGATMEQVTQRFGEPQRRADPVGDPPITRWDYEGFVLYFEHDRLLRAVPQREGAAPD